MPKVVDPIDQGHRLNFGDDTGLIGHYYRADLPHDGIFMRDRRMLEHLHPDESPFESRVPSINHGNEPAQRIV